MCKHTSAETIIQIIIYTIIQIYNLYKQKINHLQLW